MRVVIQQQQRGTNAIRKTLLRQKRSYAITSSLVLGSSRFPCPSLRRLSLPSPAAASASACVYGSSFSSFILLLCTLVFVCVFRASDEIKWREHSTHGKSPPPGSSSDSSSGTVVSVCRILGRPSAWRFSSSWIWSISLPYLFVLISLAWFCWRS